MRFERGVRRLPTTRTRCLGVDAECEENTSLNLAVVGVEKLGGMFSFAAASKVGRTVPMDLVVVSAAFRALF